MFIEKFFTEIEEKLVVKKLPIEDINVEQMCECLVLNDETLRQVMSLLAVNMEEGLNRETANSAAVKMLPSFVHALPDGSERGKFLALDLGGTNFRILLITLGEGEAKKTSSIYHIPEELLKGTGEALFDMIASCLDDFLHLNHLKMVEKLPLGFTFSFPCWQTALAKAKLITWTKGFDASGVVDEDVVQLLNAALKRAKINNIDVVAVVNDTVGTLMTCAYKESTCGIGVIVGTGNNACYIEEIEKCDKFQLLDLQDHKEMIINMEWGAFGDDGSLESIRTKYDREVDEKSINAGKQFFEKMISGMYLGEIVRLLLVDLASIGLIFNGKYEAISKPHSFSTKYVSKIIKSSLDESDQHMVKEALEQIGIENPTPLDCKRVIFVCNVVSNRAAHLCAAGLATLINRMNKPLVTIGIDGSVYRFHPTFGEVMTNKLSELIYPHLNFKVKVSEDGSGIGAALIAAVAARCANV